VDTTASRYRGSHTMEDLQEYEKALWAYLNHGFTLYRAYEAADFDFPPILIRSLERRTNEFMDVADEYLKQGSEIIAVTIAREVIRKYGDLREMDRAQWRAEGILLQYRYQRNY